MKFFPTSKCFYQTVQNVAFWSISLFTSLNLAAQSNVELKLMKSDALFVGVENQVQVTVPGISSDKIYIGSDQVEIDKLENGIFNIRAKNAGKVTLTVHGEGFQYKNFDVEVKQLPDPMKSVKDPIAALRLANGQIIRDGEVTASDFQKAAGVGFVKDALTGKNKFEVVSFSVVWVRKDTDPAEAPCKSANFSEKAKALVNSAKSGDSFYIENVMVKAPNETEPRKVNSLVFHIK